MKRIRRVKALAVLAPMLAFLLVFSVGGAQQTDPDLFSPLYQVYQIIQSYFYKPELINDQEALYGAMKGMVEHLGDPYSEFLDPDDLQRFEESLEGEFTGVGIEIAIVDDILTVIAPLYGTPAEAAGIQAGDRILAIDGESTDGITSLEASAVLIRGEPGTTVVLTVRHDDGTIVDIPIVRALIELEAVRSDLLNEGQIGYIHLIRFEQDTVLELDEALAAFDLDQMTGLILDLRNNAGGLMSAATTIAGRFVDDGIVVSTEDRLSERRNYYSHGNRLPNLPMAILINRGTASASEILAGAIRDNDMGILIGENSFGKGVFQQLIEFDDGSALKVTTGEYFRPNGHEVHGVGLAPDIEVGDDVDPIDVAVEWILEHAGMAMPFNIDPKTT